MRLQSVFPIVTQFHLNIDDEQCRNDLLAISFDLALLIVSLPDRFFAMLSNYNELKM